MLNETQKGLVEFLMKQAHVIMKKEGSVPSAYFLLVEDKIAAIPPFGEELGVSPENLKEFMSIAVAYAAKELGADLTVLVDEVWTVSVSPPETIKSKEEMRDWAKEQFPRPSEHPDREEQLMAVVMSPGGETALLSSRIYRDEKGAPHLGEAEWNDPDENSRTRLLRAWATDA